MAGCLDDLVWRNKYVREETKSKYIRQTCTPDYDICSRSKGRNTQKKLINVGIK